MDVLMSKIHSYVEEAVDEYIQEILKSKIREKGESEHTNVSNNEESIDEQCINKKKRSLPCSSITAMGRPCKYKRANGNSLCKKHMNKLTEKNFQNLITLKEV
jgi:hypothetical protein